MPYRRAGAAQQLGLMVARKSGPAVLCGATVLLAALLVWRQMGSSRGAVAPFVTHDAAAQVPPAAAAAGAGANGSAPVDLALAHLLLPLTNLSALTTAALLDANKGLGSAQARALMQLHQELYCRARLHVPDPPGTTRSTFSNVSLLLYMGGDIVSNQLRGISRSWESAEVQEMLAAMRTPVPASPAELRSPKAWKKPASPFVVDVGANVGWFALNAAAARGTVAAFEAMASNIALLRASLCGASWLSARVALYGTGLGTKRSDCHILSGKENRGDGHVVCDQDPVATATQWTTNTSAYESRGGISLMRLDSLIDHDVHVMKIDVEGFEPEVLSGADGLLSTRNVWFIMAECNTGMLKEAGVAKLIKRLDALGYRISPNSFRGPFMPDADARAGRPPNFSRGGMTLFCVKQELRDSVAAAGGPRAAWGRGLLGGGGGGGGGRGAGGGAEAAADAAWAAWYGEAAAAGARQP